MTLQRLIFILTCVIIIAGATVYIGTSLMARLALPPIAGLAMLSIAAMCASFGWRIYKDRDLRKNDDK